MPSSTSAIVLPLPLAQLRARATYAKSPSGRLHAWYYLWEAMVKLLAVQGIIECSARQLQDPELEPLCASLRHPSMGHWWRLARSTLAVLERHDYRPAQALRQGLDAERDDLPKAARLEAELRRLLSPADAKVRSSGSSVRIGRLFDQLVQYRNKRAHGAQEMWSAARLEQLGQVFAEAMAEIVRHGRLFDFGRMVYVHQVRGLDAGDWLIERFLLEGSEPQPLEKQYFPASQARDLPRADSVYLWPADVSLDACETYSPQRRMDPLVEFDIENLHFYFLNARRGKTTAELLCYTSGDDRRQLLSVEHRDLLARLLGRPANSSEHIPDEEVDATIGGEEPPHNTTADPETRRLGGYELLSVVGVGGMGKVYRARQPSLDREVALKRLLRVGDPRAEARFQREIRILGRVEHPHLIKIYTSGSDQDDSFYVMELIEGADLASILARLASRPVPLPVTARDWQQAYSAAWLAARLQEHPLSAATAATGSQLQPASPPGDSRGERTDAGSSDAGNGDSRSYVVRVADLARQVAAALHALHEHQVIHRDVKPGNIMLTGDGQAVLMDLGLAQVDNEATYAATRQFVGTLRYASPEQVLAAGQLTRRSDIYSLGGTLWELLTLTPLYGANEHTSLPELMQHIQSTIPPPPNRINSAVPRDLAAIVMKCLEKHPAQRYPTAQYLADDLTRWLQGEVVQAQPLSLAYVLQKSLHRHRYRFAILGLLLIAAGTLSVSWVYSLISYSSQLAAQQQTLEVTAYVSDIRLAAQLLDNGNRGTAREILSRHLPPPLQPDRRGIEWHLLWRQCAARDQAFSVHQNVVRALAASPDGRYLATGDWDGRLRIYDRHQKMECREYQLPGRIFGVAVAHTQPLVAAGGTGGTIHLHRFDETTAVRQLPGHTDTLKSLAFSADDQWLYSCGDDGTCRVWNVATGQQHALLGAGLDRLHSVALAPSGALATGGRRGEIHIWNPASSAFTRLIRLENNVVLALAYSRHGRWLAAGIGDADRPALMKLWSVDTWDEGPRLSGFSSRIYSVAFSPDETVVAGGCADGTVHFWKTETGERLGSFEAHHQPVTSIHFLDDGRTLMTAGRDKVANLWSLPASPPLHPSADSDGQQSPQVIAIPEEASAAVASLAFSSDSRQLAFTRGGQVFRHALSEPPVAAPISGAEPADFLLAPTSRPHDIILVPSGGGPLRHLTGDPHHPLQPLPLASPGPTVRAAASADGRWLALADHDRTIRIWDVRQAQLQCTVSTTQNSITALAWFPDRPWLVIGCHQGEIRIVNGRNGQLEMHQKAEELLSDIQVAPTGQQLAVSFLDGRLLLYDVPHWTRRALEGHRDQVLTASWSPDGRTLASGSADGTIILWNVALARQLMHLTPPRPAAITVVRFSPDAAWLAGGTAAGEVCVWRGASLDGLSVVREAASRPAARP